jgi:hypothetical protein
MHGGHLAQGNVLFVRFYEGVGSHIIYSGAETDGNERLKCMVDVLPDVKLIMQASNPSWVTPFLRARASRMRKCCRRIRRICSVRAAAAHHRTLNMPPAVLRKKDGMLRKDSK